MNELGFKESVDKLESILLNVIYLKPEERLVAPNIEHLSDIKAALNCIFADCTCQSVLYSLNTDKPFFGIRVNPVMSAQDAVTILTTDEKIKFSKYSVELDSKLFEIEMDAAEITAMIIHEVAAMIDSYEVVDQVRALIDLYLLSEDDIISIRDSINYSQLIIFALKDTLFKVSSAMFKEDPEDLTSNQMIKEAELEDALISAQQKILSSSYGVGESVRTPKTIILRWMFMVYKDMSHNSEIIKYYLNDEKDFTASKLDIAEIDKTLEAISRIGAQSFTESVRIDKLLESKAMYSVSEISLFKSLKSNGLKGIEDALYEYAIRIKNCETEEDAMYILRGINTRLGILEDYINNTPDMSDSERKHWTMVAMQYRKLREDLAKKKIWNKSQYGLFFDYSALDKLDEEE